MIRQIWRHIMLWVADNKTIERWVKKRGMKPGGFAQQFLAGETIDEAMSETKRLNDMGIATTATILGESVTDSEGSYKARDINLELLDKIHATGASKYEAGVSVKLTQLGLDISKDLCMENMQTILQRAKEHNIYIRIDMEMASVVQVTLDIWEELYRNITEDIGVVIQAYLFRSEEDIRYVSNLGGRIRLVKGAYYEAKDVAFQKKSEVDANYVHLTDLIMEVGVHPGIATHDPEMIEVAKKLAKKHNVDQDSFEFQQNYGIRTYYHEQRLKEGYKLRSTIPFGKEWFPYYTRRLAERPANAGMVLKSVLRFK